MKKIFIVALACLFLFSNQAYAHTGLESSNPANGSSVTEALNEIILTFETKIEETSSFKLVNDTNEEVAVSNISIVENTMTGIVDRSIENGRYSIQWKIIGVDGHPIKGKISFTLNAPVVEDTEEVATEVEPEQTEVVTIEEVSENEATTAETTKPKVEEATNNSSGGLIIVLVVVVAGAVFWMMRRKNK
jgi:methionine-rich copper-binding protein CopC